MSDYIDCNFYEIKEDVSKPEAEYFVPQEVIEKMSNLPLEKWMTKQMLVDAGLHLLTWDYQAFQIEEEKV